MAKHAEAIPLSVFDHCVELALKELVNNYCIKFFRI